MGVHCSSLSHYYSPVESLNCYRSIGAVPNQISFEMIDVVQVHIESEVNSFICIVMMSDKFARSFIYKFMKTELSEENIYFYEGFESLQSIPADDVRALKAAITHMVEEFLLEDSPREINISHQLKFKLSLFLKEDPHYNCCKWQSRILLLLGEVKTEVIHIITGVFPRFICSSIWLEWIAAETDRHRLRGRWNPCAIKGSDAQPYGHLFLHAHLPFANLINRKIWNENGFEGYPVTSFESAKEIMLSAVKTRRFVAVLVDMDSFGGAVDFLIDYRAAEAQILAKSKCKWAYQIIIGATENATACVSDSQGSVNVKSLVDHSQRHLLNGWFRKPHTKEQLAEIIRVAVNFQELNAELADEFFCLQRYKPKPFIRPPLIRGSFSIF